MDGSGSFQKSPEASATRAAIDTCEAAGITTLFNFRQERQIATEFESRLRFCKCNSIIGQKRSFYVAIVSKVFLRKTLGEESFVDTFGCYTWRLSSYADLMLTVEPLFRKFDDVGIYGLSGPIQRSWEPYVTVVATLIPGMELVATSQPAAMDHLRVNFQYCLLYDDGSIQEPILQELAPQVRKQLRERTHADLRNMHKKGVPLSAKFLRLIDVGWEAFEAEQAKEEAEFFEAYNRACNKELAAESARLEAQALPKIKSTSGRAKILRMV